MTFMECFKMLQNLACMKKDKGYVSLRYQYSENAMGEGSVSRISCYSDATGNWTGEFQSYEDVIRDFSLQLAKKTPEQTP